MEKLESLVNFKRRTLNKEMMSKIYGGVEAPPPDGVNTGAGTVCVSTSVSSSGCMSYSKDYMEVIDGQIFWKRELGSDVNQPCTP